MEERERSSGRTVNIGLAANVGLSIVKTAAGVLGNSPALLADGINSTSDVAYYIVVKIFVTLSGKPPDEEHPYGHSQLESIAALVVGAFVVTTAIAVFWNAISTMLGILSGASGFAGASLYALWIAIGTICVKIVLYFYTDRVSKKTANPALEALAYDHRNDILASSAAAIGIYLGRQGFLWGDPLAGAAVAILIMATGIKILRGSSMDLMDTVPGRELNARIARLLAPVPEIKLIDRILAHRFGPYYVINITISIDGALTVARGDEIATRVEEAIHRDLEFIKMVHVHYHPIEGELSPCSLEGAGGDDL